MDWLIQVATTLLLGWLADVGSAHQGQPPKRPTPEIEKPAAIVRPAEPVTADRPDDGIDLTELVKEPDEK